MNNKIYTLTTCVNFSDMLDISMDFNRNIFGNNMVIVTTKEDTNTQEICKKYDQICIISNRCYDNGATFNKGKMLNDGLDYIYNTKNNNDWTLLIDSDIIVNPDLMTFEFSGLDPETIYGCYRAMIKSENDLISYLTKYELNFRQSIIEYPESDRTNFRDIIGYFQLFNKQYYHEENHDGADLIDLYFSQLFDNRINLGIHCLHIGERDNNWLGRKSRKFIKTKELETVIRGVWTHNETN